MPSYNTNLAAEFYVLSCLHRLGLNANLTLGNKKGVDVVVALDAGEAITIEVKGLAKKYDWPANNLKPPQDPNRHIVALVCFEGRINKLGMPPPQVWIIPFPDVKQFIRSYPGGRVNVSRNLLVTNGGRFENAWNQLEVDIPNYLPFGRNFFIVV